MPAPSPQLDEHGFPIPPTFDGHAQRRRPGAFLGGAWKAGLVLVFAGLLLGLLFKSDLADGTKQLIARQLVARAAEKHQFGDLQGALADLDRAASWSPDNPVIYAYRANWKLEANDVTGSLKDSDQLIRLAPRYAQGYLHRSQVYQRLDRHREAIDDLTKAISLSPSDDPTPRNNRAYARAIANVELDEALLDVERAIGIVDQQITDVLRHAGETSDVTGYNYQKAAYLDTRGYIHFLQDRLEPAVDDLNKAIELTVNCQDQVLPRAPAAERSALQQRFNHELAVMYHHRGQALTKLGKVDEGKLDLDKGDRLGYNPAAGVF
jgi:tetratricopeptide (TPR) repeat protein